MHCLTSRNVTIDHALSYTIHLVTGIVRCQIRSLYSFDILAKNILIVIVESKSFHALLCWVHDSDCPREREGGLDQYLGIGEPLRV